MEHVVHLRNATAFVTGAAGGQGAEHARLLAHLGARVVLADLDQAAVNKVADDVDGDTLAVGLDVRDSAAWDTALDETRQRFGRVDVLVNNAAVYRPTPLEELDEAALRETIDINLIGVILGMQRTLPLMRDNGGSIINIASIAGLRGHRGAVAYSASKFGVRGATRSAAHEFGPYGIRVNCICPGAIDTVMISEETRAGGGAVANIPLPRAGAVSEVASLVAFLASDASSYCTGQDFVIDGGMTA